MRSLISPAQTCDSKLTSTLSRRHAHPIAPAQAAQFHYSPLAAAYRASSCHALGRRAPQPLCTLIQQQQLAQIRCSSSSSLQQPWYPGRQRRSLRCSVAAQEQPTAGTTGEEVPGTISSTTQEQPSSNMSAESQQMGEQQPQQQQQQSEAGSNRSSSSGGNSSGDSAQADSEQGIQVKVLSESREVNAVANLRAEAYYENDRSRYAGSFKKQFAAQEAESLRQRTAPTNNAQRPQLCDCLVAVDASGAVLGCMDIRLPETCTKMRTIGVPDGDPAGCYLLNVVVAENIRGQGVGKRVMRAAMHRAVKHWGAERLYTHVEADNEVANRLYRSCGFQEHSSEAKYANTSGLGRLVLLMATADDVDEQQAYSSGSSASSSGSS